MDPALLVAIIGALGLGGAVTAIVSTVGQRRKVGADATAVVTAAARELVDPLRKELATERAERALEVEMERRNLMAVKAELAAALELARALRVELTQVRAELDKAWSVIDAQKRRVRQLEAQIAKNH